MLNVFTRSGDGRAALSTDAEQLVAAFHDPTTQFWVDISAPTEADFALLKDLFGFHPLAIEDVIHEVQRPKLESYAMVGDKFQARLFFSRHPRP